LLEQKWYKTIQVKYQHLCDGELINSTHNSDSEIEEESNEDDEQEEANVEESGSEDEDEEGSES